MKENKSNEGEAEMKNEDGVLTTFSPWFKDPHFHELCLYEIIDLYFSLSQ